MTVGLWLSLLAVIGTWAIVFVGVSGSGLAFRRLLGATATADGGISAAFWQGLVLTLLYLQLWQLVLPIDGRAGAVLLTLGTAGWAWVRPPLSGMIGGRFGVLRLSLLALAAGLMLWAADRALAAPSAYDTGLYQLAAVAWAKTYAIVPGLANLHGRLGFNGSSLLFAAMLDTGPWSEQSTHLANGFLLLVFLLESLRQFGRLKEGSAPLRPALFRAVLLGMGLVLLLNPFFSASLTTDLPAALLLLVALEQGYRFLLPDGEGRPAASQAVADFVLLTSAATGAACVKLSAACVAGLLWLVVAWVWYRRKDLPHDDLRRGLRWALALSLALALSWSVRSAVLSGYPAYPASFAPLAVDWKVPAEQVSAERDWIRQFARVHFLNHRLDGDGIWNPAGWAWVPSWVRGTIATEMGIVHVVLPLSLGGFALLVWFARRGWRQPTAPWLLLVPLLGGSLFWFLTAPRPDFGLCTFWPLAALCGAEAGHAALPGGGRGGPMLVALLSVLLVAGVGLTQRVSTVLTTTGNPKIWPVLRRILVVPAGARRFGIQPAPVAISDSFVTTSGLRLLVPRDDGRCWISALPCTPHPATNLRLRRPGDLAGGFAVDGAWAAERWPNIWGDFLRQWRASQRDGVGHGR